MLRGYLTRLFAARALGALFGLAAILQLLDLLDQASTILTRAGLAGLFRYVGWRTPALLTEMIPLAVLLGALLTFMRLAGSLEMGAMRAAGLSVWQVVGRLLPVALAVSAASLAMQAELAPRSERGFADWWASVAPADEAPPARLWLRARGDVAAIDRVSLDGARLDGLTIVQRTEAGDLTARLDAGHAEFAHGRWTLHDLRVALPDRTDAQAVPDAPWPHGPLPANMVELARPVDTQTVDRLVATLRGTWSGSRGPDYSRTQLHALAAGALSPLLMVLLAAPVLFNPPRSGAGALQTATCLALGLLYMTASGLLVALGGAGVLPPLVAGWTALLAFAGYGALRLVQAEDG
jgi:lipopolysaccharide export system permease protein